MELPSIGYDLRTVETDPIVLQGHDPSSRIRRVRGEAVERVLGA